MMMTTLKYSYLDLSLHINMTRIVIIRFILVFSCFVFVYMRGKVTLAHEEKNRRKNYVDKNFCFRN